MCLKSDDQSFTPQVTAAFLFPHTVSVILPALLVFGVRRLRRQRRLEGALDGANDVVDILLARLLLLRQGLPPELRALERGDRAAARGASLVDAEGLPGSTHITHKPPT